MNASPTGTKPTTTERRSAAYANQRCWIERIGALDQNARPCEIFRSGELVAARTGVTGAIMLPAPPARATVSLSGALTWLRARGSGDVMVWSSAPNLAVNRWLSAQGARAGFEPLWMFRDLEAPVAPEGSAGPIIREATPGDLPQLLHETAIPYTTAWQARATHHLATAPSAAPGVRLLVAVLDGRVVGRAVVNLAGTPDDGTAGIYDLAVHPEHQRRGTGRELTRSALRIARHAGASVATLNSTPAGERMYRAMGFDDAGRGQTWLLPEQTLRHPPPEDVVWFAMLISGGSEIPAVMRRHARSILPNGESPLAHAARFHQPDVARSLLAMGTVPDIAALWRLGLRDDAREMMRNPLALQARRDQEGATPLHLAIRWRDDELLTALLDAGASPHLKDRSFQADAWGWAKSLGNESALCLLNARFPESAEL